MAVFETKSGKRLDVNPPPRGIWPELDEVTEKYEKLRRDRKVTATRLGGLRGQRERLIDEERIALARAIKNETPEPKSKLPAIEKEIKVADERLAALEEAIDLVLEDMIAVADEMRDAWTPEVLEQVAEAQAEYAGQLKGSQLRLSPSNPRSHFSHGCVCFRNRKRHSESEGRTSLAFVPQTRTRTRSRKSSRLYDKTRKSRTTRVRGCRVIRTEQRFRPRSKSSGRTRLQGVGS